MTSTNRGVGLVVSDTNTYTNTKTCVQDCNLLYEQGKTSEGLVRSVRPQPQYVRGSTSSVCQKQCFTGTEVMPLCRVQFTQHHFEDTAGNHVDLVFITNYENGASNWALLGQGKHFHHFYVYQCELIPSGPIQIINSVDMHMQWQYQQVTYGGGHTDPNNVYQTFEKDCFYFELFVVTYDKYMLAIIDKLIDQAENDISENIDCRNVDVDSEVVLVTNSNGSTNHVNPYSGNNLPLKLQGNFDIPEDGTDNKLLTDCAIPGKTRVSSFKTQGISCSQAQTGQPNYRQARFPINSGLNLQAWNPTFNIILSRISFSTSN